MSKVHHHHAPSARQRLDSDMKNLSSTESSERKNLASIHKQEQAIIDQFTSGTPMTQDQEKAALEKLFGLGQQSAQVKTKDSAIIAKDKKNGRALMKKAEGSFKSLKTLNADRKELGMKALKQLPNAGGKGSSAVTAAKSVLGRNIQDLKYHGPLAKYLDKWPSDHVCCANFVSACLEKEGLIKPSEHNDSVSGLASNLSRDRNWQRVSSSHMKPGDVVCFNVPGEGPMSHVEIFEGYKNGKPEFIGSNNVNSDGSQRISQGYVGYPIGAVYRHK